MRFYEHEAKKVFESVDIPVPKQFGIVQSPDELEASSLEFPVMLKSMVLIGGRGKAGGIKKAGTMAEAKAYTTELLNLTIKDYPVEMVLIEAAVEFSGACYIGATMDPTTFNPVIIVSASGGVDIEEVAKDRPEAIVKHALPDNDKTLPEALALELGGQLAEGLGHSTDAAVAAQLAAVIAKVYQLFQTYDAKVVEINPLLITPEGPVAADAKFVLDDNALFRQTDLLEMLGIHGKRHDVSEATANERRAQKARFPYVDLLPEDYEREPDKLYVGLVPGGAGYGIFSIDEVANIGDRFFNSRVVPVNFMDSGGGPPVDRVAEMFHLLMDYPIVDLVITSRFGGISSCDIFIRGLIQALRDRHAGGKRIVPVYGRMVGTDLPSARAYLEKALNQTPEPLRDMHIVVGNQRIMAEVIKEGITNAFEARGWRA